MLSLLISVFVLNFIPKEFEQLKRKAIKSSLIRPLSNFVPEQIIMPSKPFITDSFQGIVLNPIFGENIKELKGFAVSKSRKHLAIIVDRESENGKMILSNHSYFFGAKNVTVLLSEKFADDGEVSIFNITEIDPLSAFYNFDLKLSSLKGKCKTHFGTDLGARCETSLNLNWDSKNKAPKEVTINDFPAEIQNDIKLYGGVSGNSYASATLQKRGATIQTRIDGSIDALIGGGFLVRGINNSDKIDFDKEYTVGNPISKILGQGSVSIYRVPITLRVSFVSKVLAKDISFNIPQNINYINIVRTLSIHIKKGLTITSKHAKTTDYEKVVKVDKVKTDAMELGNFYEEDSLAANFSGKLTIKAGLKAELIIASVTKFSVEMGPEIGLDLDLNVSSEKCTFPALFGSFTPFMNAYVEFAGAFIVAGIKFYEAKKEIVHQIYTKESMNYCLFDVSSSSELDKQLLESSERKRSIVQTMNPKVLNSSFLYNPNYQPIGLIGSRLSFLGFSTLYFGKSELPKENEHILIHEQLNLDSIQLQVLPDQKNNRNCVYPFEEEIINTPGIVFTFIRNESQPIIMGNQFNYSNYTEYKNFRRKFMSGDVERVGLILHTKADGYFCDPSKYYIIDEVFDEYTDYVTNWFKITISQIIQTKKLQHIYIGFFRPLDFDDQEMFIYHSMQKFEAASKLKAKMEPVYKDVYIKIKKPLKPRSDQVLMYFNITDEDGNVYGPESITYANAISSSFVKKVQDIEITFNSNSNIEDIEYILQLEDFYKDELKKIPNLELSGIVTRVFIKENNDKPVFFTGSPQNLVFTMDNNELYGTIFIYFTDPGYGIKTNNKVYAFLKLDGAQPLLKSAKCVEEKEDLYVIKLDIGKNVYLDEEENLFISIPFRRRTKLSGGVNAVLYSIYQSNENNDNDSPFCNDFPEFNLTTNKNFYVGCIRTYTNLNDLYDNKWDQYPESLNEHLVITDYPIDLPKDDSPFVRLHSISYQPKEINESKAITIVAKQQYFNFPEESRTMIIEDDTINKFKKYAPNVPLQISCARCGDIYINDILKGTKMFQEQTNYFTTLINNASGGFLLEAYCKKEENAYCNFEYDLSNDGETLLEFNTQNNLRIKHVLDDSINISAPDQYPGVEEIYDATKDTSKSANYRFNVNCNKQIIPARSGKIYLNKPWEGEIKKIVTHIERKTIEIDIDKVFRNNYINFELKGKGFKSLNSKISDEQSIPFNPKFFAEDENKFKSLLLQLGIKITKTKEQTTNDNDVEVDDNGILRARRNLFDENLLKDSINKSKIDLIPISNYKFKEGYTAPKDEDKKNGNGKKNNSCGSGGSKNKLSDKLNPLSLGNFNINHVYIGGSKVSNFPLGYISNIFPSFFFIHTAIWVGEYDESDDELGIIFVYGKYLNDEVNDPNYIFSDGAMAYTMSFGIFKKLYDAFNVQKVKQQKNYKLFDFIKEVKKSGNWTVNRYNWALLNCQHFTAACLNIFQAKRFSNNSKDWDKMPKIIKNAINPIN